MASLRATDIDGAPIVGIGEGGRDATGRRAVMSDGLLRVLIGDDERHDNRASGAPHALVEGFERAAVREGRTMSVLCMPPVPRTPLQFGKVLTTLWELARLRNYEMVIGDFGSLRYAPLLRRKGLLAVLAFEPLPCCRGSGTCMDARHGPRLRLLSRADVLAVVSRAQQSRMATLLGGDTTVVFTPMSVDPDFWSATAAGPADPCDAMLAHGAERDYELAYEILTAIEARDVVVVHRRGLPSTAVRVLHRLRSEGIRIRVFERAPAKVVRDHLAAARTAIVPVRPSNQPAGLTALLEALAVGTDVLMPAAEWLEDYVDLDPHGPPAQGACAHLTPSQLRLPNFTAAGEAMMELVPSDRS